MNSLKLIAFFVSAVFVRELKTASLNCHCGNAVPTFTTYSISEVMSTVSLTTDLALSTVADDIMCLSKCPSSTQTQGSVCGNNGVTYPSLAALECAKSCGVDVNLVSNASCPTSSLNSFS